MKMNIRIKILSVFIPLCLFLCFMSNTYSRYVADTTGNLKMSFAQWQILVNNEDIINNSSSSIVLTPVIDENENVVNNKIAPSSSGYFDINIDPSNVDVSFNYSISLDVLNENIPDLIITKYAILDENGTIVLEYYDKDKNLLLPHQVMNLFLHQVMRLLLHQVTKLMKLSLSHLQLEFSLNGMKDLMKRWMMRQIV